MRILAIADRVENKLYEQYAPSFTNGIDLMIACGDLPQKYLEFLTTVVNKPLYYVHGNHDSSYVANPPEGCISLEDQVVKIGSLRIAGLGGSMRYRKGPYQYTEREMAGRVRRLAKAIRQAGGVDILVTHAPLQGFGDLPDQAHQGFACLHELASRYRPQYILHGHVHPEYTLGFTRRTLYEPGVTIVNCAGSVYIEIEEGTYGMHVEAERKCPFPWIHRQKG